MADGCCASRLGWTSIEFNNLRRPGVARGMSLRRGFAASQSARRSLPVIDTLIAATRGDPRSHVGDAQYPRCRRNRRFVSSIRGRVGEKGDNAHSSGMPALRRPA